jgi:hypothetical protein
MTRNWRRRKENSDGRGYRPAYRKFGGLTKQRFGVIYELIGECASQPVREKLWAGLPSFYAGDHFVRVIPFKDHINIEAPAILPHAHELSRYKITPRGMLQIPHTQSIPGIVLNPSSEKV